MQNQEIEISILPDGRVAYTVKGVPGSACESVSALLEQLGKIEETARTGEYFEDETHVDVSLS
ncbi:MAG: DUF2997 domain-containing protein [Chloroflexi bacterium]|nr:DUF2997 domain-containing protein [Chloroflexota bacterium]